MLNRRYIGSNFTLIKDKFPDYNSFGLASLEDVYGKPQLEAALQLQAHTFASVYLENKGKEGFVLHELPPSTQLAAIKSIAILKNDMIIGAGNHYRAEVETPRNDAGLGWMMKWNKNESFKVSPGLASGLRLDGEVTKLREITLSNGKMCVIASRNGGVLSVILIEE